MFYKKSARNANCAFRAWGDRAGDALFGAYCRSVRSRATTAAILATAQAVTRRLFFYLIDDRTVEQDVIAEQIRCIDVRSRGSRDSRGRRRGFRSGCADRAVFAALFCHPNDIIAIQSRFLADRVVGPAADHSDQGDQRDTEENHEILHRVLLFMRFLENDITLCIIHLPSKASAISVFFTILRTDEHLILF